MDQAKLDKMIKENRGILRQLTYLNNRVKKLEKTREEFMNSIENFNRRGYEIIPDIDTAEENIANIKAGGTD